MDVPTELEKPIWEIYNEYNKSKFRNLSFEKGLENKLFTLTDIVNANNFSVLNNDICLQIDKINQIKKLLGINNTQQIGGIITKKKLNEVSPKLLEMKKEIYATFSLRDSRAKDFNELSMLNMVFSKWGLTQLKKGKQERKQKDGIRIDTTPVVLTGDYDIDVYKYIKPKRISTKLDEPKRRPELEEVVTHEEKIGFKTSKLFFTLNGKRIGRK